MRILIVFTLILWMGGSTAQGLVDGFFKGKGNTDVALSVTHQSSDKYYAGTKLINYERRITSVGLFAEHGITSKFDVIGNVPFINGNFQDASVFLKYQLAEVHKDAYKLNFILASGVSFPLSNYQTESGQAIGQRATVFSPKGVVQFMLSKGLFLQAQSGYNLAVEPVRSSVPFSMKIGYAYSKFYADVWYDYQRGFGDKDYQGSVPFDSFRELVVNYQRVGGVLYYSLQSQTGVFLSGSYTLNGRNTGKAYGISTGFVIKLSPKASTK